MSLISSSLSEVHKTALRVCRVDLEDDLAVEHIMTRFRQRGIITLTMQDNILAERTPTMKCRTFLDMLETRGKDAFVVFITALKEAKYTHLAERLEKEVALQSLALAVNSLRIATENVNTLHTMISKEHNVAICSSMDEVQSLLTRLQKTLILKELSEPCLTLKCKIELSHSCMGLCESPNGEIVIVEHEQGIIVYNKDLTFKMKFAVSMPTDAECLPTGEILVSSRYNNCVKKFDNDGQYIRDICGEINEPHAMSYSQQVGLVVIGSKPECIYICKATGEITRTIKKNNSAFYTEFVLTHIRKKSLYQICSPALSTASTKMAILSAPTTAKVIIRQRQKFSSWSPGL
ncbi:unnamed protein product [Owenia fusiformis]|uniref:CARD domain-containing protein n=1 Tax=Owenia fusiformis TaxID=6347 RepID=A0A8S4PTR7_OWEFU|nr:unnamed protein product [Owenia fusiformis]